MLRRKILRYDREVAPLVYNYREVAPLVYNDREVAPLVYNDRFCGFIHPPIQKCMCNSDVVNALRTQWIWILLGTGVLKDLYWLLFWKIWSLILKRRRYNLSLVFLPLSQDLGHKIMADLAVWLFQQTAIDLILRPFGDDDMELIEEGLPPPMYPGVEGCEE